MFSVKTAGKNSGMNEAYSLNGQAQNYYQTRLRLLATSCFEWDGLPKGVPERFIENYLYTNGKLAFAKDPIVGLICCKCTLGADFTMYDEPKSYYLTAINGYNEEFKREDVVLIRNNKDEIPTNLFTDYYIKQLYEIDRTIATNVIQQKTSKIILCDEAQKLTMENLLMQYEGNIPFIHGYKQLDINAETIKNLDLSSPYVADRLQDLKREIWRECMDMLGINNANTTKRERLISDEVNSNNQLLELSSDVFLESRKLACEEINKEWGLNVSVKRRVENGEIYDGVRDFDKGEF